MKPVLIQKWEEILYVPKEASTAMASGIFLEYNGTGEAQPLQPTNPVLGLNLMTIASTDSDFASEKKIPYQTAEGNKFLMPVTTGTATANMIGDTFDITAADSYGLDVSGAGTQFVIREFIAADLVIAEPILIA